MARTLLTKAEYARHRGCSEKAVRKALAEGRISAAGSGRRCIDAAVADLQWANNTRARAGSARDVSGTAPPGAGAGAARLDYASDRARRERAEADRAEVLALREAGRLLLREPAERAVFDAFKGLRDAVFQALREVAPEVRDLSDVPAIQLALEGAARRAFVSFDAAMRGRLDELADSARR